MVLRLPLFNLRSDGSDRYACALEEIGTLKTFVVTVPRGLAVELLGLMKLVSLYDQKEIEKRAASPTLTFKANVPYEDREKAKSAGFKWQAGQKEWVKVVKQFEYEQIKDSWKWAIYGMVGVGLAKTLLGIAEPLLRKPLQRYLAEAY